MFQICSGCVPVLFVPDLFRIGSGFRICSGFGWFGFIPDLFRILFRFCSGGILAPRFFPSHETVARHGFSLWAKTNTDTSTG